MAGSDRAMGTLAMFGATSNSAGEMRAARGAFAGHLAARAVFKVRSTMEGFGPVEVRTSKSQVAFTWRLLRLWDAGQEPISANRGGGLIDRLGPS